MPALRVIKLSGSKIFLTEADYLPLSATSLPAETVAELAHLNQDIYWEVIADYNPDTQHATLRVADFIPDYEQIKTFRKTAATNSVRFIQFEPFNEAAYHIWQVRYQKPVSQQWPRLNHSEDAAEDLADWQKADGRYGPIFQPQPPRPTAWTATFKHRFAEAEFAAGEVSGVWSKPPQGRQPVAFQIPNPHVRAEFGYIRDYLTRKLGSKTFDVSLSVLEYPGGRREVAATSQLINSIDQQLIETWRTRRAQQASKLTAISPDASPAPTLTEVAQQLREAGEPASLISAAELQSILIDRAINRRQIQHLAQHKHDISTPVRFTFGQYVGFVFLVGGVQNHHFCWELLNSNATYLWSFPPEIAYGDALTSLETALRLINKEGRIEYRKQHSTLSTNLLRFVRIDHTRQGLTEDEVFDRWNRELNSLLT